MFRRYKFKNLNFKLIIGVVALTIIGILVIGSANYEYQSRQILGMILGIVVMAAVALIDYDVVLQFSWVYYLAVVVLLVLVLLIGDSSGGATRWIDFGIRFQPSELGKILLILFFSSYLMRHEDDINNAKFLLKTALIAAVPLALIVKEPDLSTTIVTFLIIAILLFATGLSYKIVGTVIGIAAPLIAVLLLMVVQGKQTVLLKYMDLRILAWLKPEDYPSDAYQQQNSIMAIGFVGSLLIVGLLLFITYQCIRTAKKAKDLSGQLICIGMAALIGVQSFVNICVVTGLLPNTGLPLPFVSYGLTSLVTLYFGIGFVLNVGLQAKKY